MNISEMSDQEKSVILARVCGWPFSDKYFRDTVIELPSGQIRVGSLYEPKHMALAWAVLNWAINGDRINIHASYDVFVEIGGWLRSEFIVMASLPPATAQRLWLDKVLALAIEAGLVAPQEQAGKEEATG